MIELKKDRLVFSFSEVHRDARFTIDFQRTLRVPDDGGTYPLPPGLGRFPVRHVDDFASRIPDDWRRHGGVMLPMYQSEALWLNFRGGYPFAVKVAAGKIDAITGEHWNEGLHRDPQNYLVTSRQPWLDGYCVEEGKIRQFVAMPLGGGYTIEEQVTGEAEHGGLQIVAYPMKAGAYRKMREREAKRARTEAPLIGDLTAFLERAEGLDADVDMGLGAGGRMDQDIYEDPYRLDAWDTRHGSRCFVHIANSLAWRAMTGEDPPTAPLTAHEYNEHGLPWFEYYADDAPALPGAEVLAGAKSVAEIGKEKDEHPLPENETVEPKRVVRLGRPAHPDKVREGTF